MKNPSRIGEKSTLEGQKCFQNRWKMQKGRKVGCGTLLGRSPSSVGRADSFGVGPKSRFVEKKSPRRAILGPSWAAKWVQNRCFLFKIVQKSWKSRSRRGFRKSSEKWWKNDARSRCFGKVKTLFFYLFYNSFVILEVLQNHQKIMPKRSPKIDEIH